MIKICLDPGHGQYENQSPNNKSYYEGTQMYKLSQFLTAELESYGMTVINTRKYIGDNPNVTERGNIAGVNGCDLFLSLHSNAPAPEKDGSYSKTCTGTVVFYSLTRPENKILADALGVEVSSIMNHYFRGSMIKEYPGQPTWDYYGVLRNSANSGCKCAMIIEHGFHTSNADSEFLLKDENLKKLASAEAEIIANYFGICEKINTDPEKEPVKPKTIIYRVQVGAFIEKRNAENYRKKLVEAGFTDAYITTT